MIPKELQNMKPLEGNESIPRDADYMGAIDFEPGAEPVLTIDQLYNGEITLSQGKKKKTVITFVEERVHGINEVRPLVLNKINWKTMRKMFGDMKASTLKGKRIQLYLQPGVRNPGTKEIGNGIRIREKIPDGTKYEAPKCEACGKAVTGSGSFSAEQIASASRQKYGKCLCIECGKKAKEAQEKAEQAQAEKPQETPQKAEEQMSLAERLAAEMEV